MKRIMNTYWIQLTLFIIVCVVALHTGICESTTETSKIEAVESCSEYVKMKPRKRYPWRSYYDDSTEEPDLEVDYVKITCSSVTLKNGSLAKHIGEHVCFGCENILEITSSIVATLPEAAFIHYSNYDKINVTNVQLEYISPGAFESLNSLKELYLSDNKLTHIPDNTFGNLSRLKILDLSRNSIQILNAHAFSGLTLDTLNLSFNSLNNFESDILKRIDVLDLSSNNISKFNFTRTGKVRKLILSSNHINELVGCFTSINDLYLSKNDLKSLENINCNQNSSSNIFTLDVSDNHLSSLDPSVFALLKETGFLYLQGNNISSIPHGCFSQLHFLQFLNMSSNHLTQFSYGVFDGLYNLRILDISSNRLNYFNRSVYHSFGNLEELYLQNNEISSLNAHDLTNSAPSLMQLDLDGNNFTCNSLVEIFHILRDEVIKGKTVNVSNIHGIACRETENDSNPNMYENLVKSSAENFTHRFFKYLDSLKSDNRFNSSNMYNYFNTDFKNSNFYKYIENLSNTSNKNVFNSDFANSSFYKFLQNGSNVTTGTVLSENIALLVVIMLLLFLIASILLFVVLSNRSKLNYFGSRYSKPDRVRLVDN